MLIRYQPLDAKTSKKFDKYQDDFNERDIESQRVGRMFDDHDNVKIDLVTRLGWKWRSVKGFYHDVRYTFMNHFKWRKTLRRIRPWEGFSGLIDVMQTHLTHYVDCEEKYGHSEESFREGKINSAKEVIALLERMQEPIDYSIRRRDEVDARYPEYQSLITEYKQGGSCHSGRFVAQGKGWVGYESGANPRRGYFDFINGVFELAESPNQVETDKLLAELDEYDKEVTAAYKHAEADSEADFDKLGQLLKKHLYSWWD